MFRPLRAHAPHDADQGLTPMIDMTFQLVAFFMVLVNFADADQYQRVRLPTSRLARPPDTSYPCPITVQLTRRGSLLVAGEEVGLAALETNLRRERALLEALRGVAVRNATIVIRADRDAQAGRVQEVIVLCQRAGFQRFILRAKYEEKG